MALIVPFSGFSYLEHQVEGVKWMIEREKQEVAICRGGILADDMGLGKTWQTIGLIINAPLEFTLIVTPPVLLAQWVAAFKQSSISCATIKSGKWTLVDASVYICSYGNCSSQSDLICSRLWDRIVLDEGQYIRNGHKTKRYQAVNKITAVCRWILSGTPIQNKLSDFKNLCLWLRCDPTLLKKANRCETANTIIKRRSITLIKNKMPIKPEHVAHKLEFICPIEERKFNVLAQNLEDAIEKQFNQMMILEKYLRLHQFLSHPAIYTESMKKKFSLNYDGGKWMGGATKIQRFIEIIKNTTEPTLVFCQFKREMDLLATEAHHFGYSVHYIRGGLTEIARTAQIMGSMTAVNNSKPTIVFCQINAGNCGLNLQHLTRVIFYTQHWNPSVIDQAMARSYRFGQTKPVTVHHILIESDKMLNIDRLMLRKHKEKRLIATSVLPSLEFAYHPEIVVT